MWLSGGLFVLRVSEPPGSWHQRARPHGLQYVPDGQRRYVITGYYLCTRQLCIGSYYYVGVWPSVILIVQFG